MGFNSVQRVQIRSPLALDACGRSTNYSGGAATRAVVQFWTAAASSRLGVLINRAFRKLRESVVGLLFLRKRCLKQLNSVIQAEFSRPRFQGAIPGDLVMLHCLGRRE